MRKVVICLKEELKDVTEPKIIGSLSLFSKLLSTYLIDQRTLYYCKKRLALFNYQTEVYALSAVADFAT